MQQRLLFGDDHPIVRKGLRALVDYHFQNITVGEACSCAEIMKALSHAHYSHLLLDVVFPDGTILEILPNIISLYPKARISAFSMQSAEIFKPILQKYRVNYFIAKTLSEDSIVALLRKFLNDLSPTQEDAAITFPDNPFALLTARELEILHYILKGMGSNQIGSILNIKYNTVSTARNSIYEKSHTGTLTQLFELASKYNIT